MSKKLTLDQIAEKAGVSRSTASRVLNGHRYVSESARARVMRVIQETGYQPNAVAQSLASQRSNVLGLILPRDSQALFEDPYFPQLLQGMVQACDANDYLFSLSLVQNQEDEVRLYNRLTRRGYLDGVVIQVGHIDDGLIDYLKRRGEIPFVVAGRPANAEGISYVDVDNASGAYHATQHLIGLGHSRIATITGAMNTTAGQDRYQGYERAILEEGLPVDESLVAAGDYTELSGYRAMQRLLPHMPSALFAASDAMALGALKAIQEAGLSVPGDIALVSFDDLPPAQLSKPQLTTMRQPVQEFGAKAVELLLELIGQEHPEPLKYIFETTLVVRESCGATAENNL